MPVASPLRVFPRHSALCARSNGSLLRWITCPRIIPVLGVAPVSKLPRHRAFSSFPPHWQQAQSVLYDSTPSPDSPRSSTIDVTLDGHPVAFDAVFLRDSCTCPLCVHPSSRQKNFQTCDIPATIRGKSVALPASADQEAGIEISWESDVPGWPANHRTQHSREWLRRAHATETKLATIGRNVDPDSGDDGRIVWDRDIITEKNKWIDFEDYMGSDETVFDALTHLQRYGLLFLRGMPDDEKAVEHIISRIGILQDSFYGRTWDVKSVPGAKNIAYTQHFLGLHMDLLYTTNPPHLQLLHSLRARSSGGSSLFSDTFHACSILRLEQPELFATLCSFPVTYHYHNDSQHYRFVRPTIELQSTPATLEQSNHSLVDELTRRRIKNVNWSPPFQGPFDSGIVDSRRIPGFVGHTATLAEYRTAAEAFDRLICADESIFEYRLEEGECVIFDNRRVLHARREFDASKGERWLKGAYVADDVFYSRLRVLQERYEGSWVAEGVRREAVE